MGSVFRAVHERTEAFVALKTVRVENPDALGAIRREILALSKLDHPVNTERPFPGTTSRGTADNGGEAAA